MTLKSIRILFHALTFIILAAAPGLCTLLLASCGTSKPPLTDGNRTGETSGTDTDTDTDTGEAPGTDESLITAKDSETCETPPDTILRVGSYNIKNGSQVNHNFKLIADDIIEMNLDIVGLQEVDQLTNRNGRIDTMKNLGQFTGYYYKFAKAISYQGGEYGVGILSRYPIESFEIIRLYSGGKEQRVLSHAVININGFQVDFFNTHLSYESRDIRDEQFKAVARKLADYQYFILTGDFNTSDTAEFTVIAKSFLVNPKKYVTFPGGKSHIDNIVLSENWAVIDSGTLEKGHSDHSMLWAEIKLQK